MLDLNFCGLLRLPLDGVPAIRVPTEFLFSELMLENLDWAGGGLDEAEEADTS